MLQRAETVTIAITKKVNKKIAAYFKALNLQRKIGV